MLIGIVHRPQIARITKSEPNVIMPIDRERRSNDSPQRRVDDTAVCYHEIATCTASQYAL